MCTHSRHGLRETLSEFRRYVGIVPYQSDIWASVDEIQLRDESRKATAVLLSVRAYEQEIVVEEVFPAAHELLAGMLTRAAPRVTTTSHMACCDRCNKWRFTSRKWTATKFHCAEGCR
jgi:hypothetical protein